MNLTHCWTLSKPALCKKSMNVNNTFWVNLWTSLSPRRLGFLGLLHMEVFNQRLEQEYNASVIVTAPTVPYKAILSSTRLIKVRAASCSGARTVISATRKFEQTWKWIINGGSLLLLACFPVKWHQLLDGNYFRRPLNCPVSKAKSEPQVELPLEEILCHSISFLIFFWRVTFDLI